MKNILFLIAIAVLTSCSAQTSFNNFYKENNDNSDFSIGFSNSLVGSFLSDDDEEMKELIKKAKHTRIMVFSDNWEKTNSNFTKFIKRSGFDKLVKIRDNDDNISLFIREEKELIKEIVVQISTGDELVLLGLKTNLTHDDLAKIFSDNHITLN
jgi:hypothetical protein